MAVDGIVGQLHDMIRAKMRGEELKRSDANVAARNTGQYRAGVAPLALNTVARRHCGERSRGRNVHRCHRFRNEIFAQDRTNCRPAVAVARKGGRSRALELQVEANTVGRDDFAQKQRTSITELR